MPCLCALLVTWLTLLPGSAAQEAPPTDADPRFEEAVEVHEVRLLVRVDNGLGLPVDDLTKEDFSVREDGKPVEIVDFRLLGLTGAAPESAADAESSGADAGPIASTVAEQRLPEDSVVVLLFDVLEVRPRFVTAVGKTVDWIRENADKVPDHTWITAVLDTGVGIFGSPTRDPEVLAETVAALKKRKLQDRVWRFVESPMDNSWVQGARAYNAITVGRQSPVGDEVSERLRGFEACLGKRHWMLDQIEQVQQLVESLAPIRGQKTIIWMHSSYGEPYPESCADLDIIQVTRAMQDLGALAAASGVVMHASNLGGLTSYYGAAAGSNLSEYTQDELGMVAPHFEHSLSLGSMARNMAIHTGGQRVALNDPSWIFHRAFEDPVYELTVLVPHGRDGKEHRFKIDLAGHPLAMLQYQRTYLDLSKRQLFMNQLQRSSLLPGSYGAIPVHMRWEGQSEGDHNRVQITVAAPAERVGIVEGDDGLMAAVEPWIAVHRPDGELVEVRQLHSSSLSLPADTVLKPTDAFTATATMDLPAGEYLITGAFFDRLNETSGVTSASLDLSGEETG